MKFILDKNKLNIIRMRSGRLCLELATGVCRERFRVLAEDILTLISGDVVSKNESVDIEVWEIKIGNEELWIVYEEGVGVITLESQSEGGDKVIANIKEVGFNFELIGFQPGNN